MLCGDTTHEVSGLFTTVNAVADRVAMHALRRELLQRQAVDAGIRAMASGDLFLEDIRTYRETMRGCAPG